MNKITSKHKLEVIGHYNEICFFLSFLHLFILWFKNKLSENNLIFKILKRKYSKKCSYQ